MRAARARSAARAAAGFFAGLPIEIVAGDLSDERPRDCGRCAGADAIVHVAGLTKARTLEDYREVNVAGHGAPARGAPARGAPDAHFVLVSSQAAAGPSRGGRPVARRRSGAAGLLVRPLQARRQRRPSRDGGQGPGPSCGPASSTVPETAASSRTSGWPRRAGSRCRPAARGSRSIGAERAALAHRAGGRRGRTSPGGRRFSVRPGAGHASSELAAADRGAPRPPGAGSSACRTPRSGSSAAAETLRRDAHPAFAALQRRQGAGDPGRRLALRRRRRCAQALACRRPCPCGGPPGRLGLVPGGRLAARGDPGAAL